MKTYKKILFTTKSQEESDILMALLADECYYAFEAEQLYLAAYISDQEFDEDKLKSILQGKIRYQIETIPEEDWNEEWENSFSPVIIDDFVAIRAQFHQPVSNVLHEIIITPKMSFGTGHHATTYLMVEKMKTLDFQGKSVIDFGTGTGVLSILANKLGAQNVFAIDNDPWSVRNARENIIMNHCKNIAVIEAADLEGIQQADIILANINKNILIQHSQSIVQHLKDSGTLLLSGFLKIDEEAILKTFECLGLKNICVRKNNGWLILCLKDSL